MTTVAWNGGEENGFASEKEAERYIENVCKKVAPELEYAVKEDSFLQRAK